MKKENPTDNNLPSLLQRSGTVGTIGCVQFSFTMLARAIQEALQHPFPEQPIPEPIETNYHHIETTGVSRFFK